MRNGRGLTFIELLVIAAILTTAFTVVTILYDHLGRVL